jgi:hypothetical protein
MMQSVKEIVWDSGRSLAGLAVALMGRQLQLTLLAFSNIYTDSNGRKENRKKCAYNCYY